MHRGVTCAGGVAIVLVGTVGCGGGENAGAGDTTPAPVTTKLVVDGQDRNVDGPVECNDTGAIVDIAVGGPESGIMAAVTKGDDPQVNMVTVGEVDGVSLGFIGDGVSPNGSAEVTKDGNTYRISGKVTGRDLTNIENPGPEVVKGFDLTVVCP
jgi:lipoprotein LpqH